jgi:hypothetical protein
MKERKSHSFLLLCLFSFQAVVIGAAVPQQLDLESTLVGSQLVLLNLDQNGTCCWEHHFGAAEGITVVAFVSVSVVNSPNCVSMWATRSWVSHATPMHPLHQRVVFHALWSMSLHRNPSIQRVTHSRVCILPPPLPFTIKL